MIVMLQGLAGTKHYRVQVRGVGPEGEHTEWSKIYKLTTIPSAFDSLSIAPSGGLESTLILIADQRVLTDDDRTLTTVHVYSTFADITKLYEVTALLLDESVVGTYSYEQVIEKGVILCFGTQVIGGFNLAENAAKLQFIGDDITGDEPYIIAGIREYNNGQGGAYLWSNPGT